MAWPLLELSPLILWGIAFALCAAVVYFTHAFFGITGTRLGKLPIIGGWLDATAHHIDNRISDIFGGLAARFEARVGASWHSAARRVDWIGHELAAHAALITLVADLGSHNLTLKDFRTVVHDLRRYIGGVAAIGAGIGADVLPRVKGIERGIGEDVLPRVKTLEREVHGEITRERVRARAAERTAEREITNLWKWTRTHTLQAGTLAFAGAVALALKRLGLGWLRCPSLGRLGKTVGCNGFGLLEDLLALGLEALVVADICRIANAIESAAILVEPELDKLVGLSDFMCRAGGASYPSAILDSDRAGRGGNPTALVAADLAA